MASTAAAPAARAALRLSFDAIAGHHDDRRRRGQGARRPHDVEAVAIRQPEIGDEQVRRLFFQGGEPRLARSRGDHAIPMPAQESLVRGHEVGFVLHHEHVPCLPSGVSPIARAAFATRRRP